VWSAVASQDGEATGSEIEAAYPVALKLRDQKAAVWGDRERRDVIEVGLRRVARLVPGITVAGDDADCAGREIEATDLAKAVHEEKAALAVE